MLSPDVPGAAVLARQLQAAMVRAISEYEDSPFSLEFRVDDAASLASAQSRIVSEAQYRDADGAVVVVLLHVVNGALHELEIYRQDGEAVQLAPPASELHIDPWGAAEPGS